MPLYRRSCGHKRWRHTPGKRTNHDPNKPWMKFRDPAKRILAHRLHFISKERHASGEWKADAARDPVKFTRLNVQSGSTKKADAKKWVAAEKKADEFMKILEDDGRVPLDDVVVPESDEALAKASIKEAAKIALGPTSRSDKLTALKMVLDFTKAKPVSKSEIAVSGPEEWLKNAIADNDRSNKRPAREVQD